MWRAARALRASTASTCPNSTVVLRDVRQRHARRDVIPEDLLQGDNSVRLHRLRGDRLEELARIQLKAPDILLWLADRLLVADYDSEKQSHAVIELEVSDTRLERRRELIATSDNIRVRRLCAVNDELAIFDYNSKDILHYSFA